VRVVRPGVHLQLRDLLAREAIAREHALDRLADDLGRPTLELRPERPRAETAGKAGMAVVELLVELLARNPDLLGVITITKSPVSTCGV
jgi:hypothetical protein